MKENAPHLHHLPAACSRGLLTSLFLLWPPIPLSIPSLVVDATKMAKGLRSSTKKANKSKLRSNVFGPVEGARKERLSAKLLDLASQPRVRLGEDVKMEERSSGQPMMLEINEALEIIDW